MKSRSVAVLAALLVSLSPGLTGQTPARPPAQPADAPYTMALTGDSIITRRLSPYQEPAFLQMIDLIRNADVAFTNLEMLFHDYETYAMSQSGGTYMRAEPALAKELAWAGFDLVARANNHTGDYAPEAMRLTTKYVAEAGLVGAGVGETLSEAREPHFVETARARVALVACASTFPEHSRAGDSRGSIPGRPGLSPLRFTTTYVTTAEGLAKLRDGAAAAGIGGRGGGGRGGGGGAAGAAAPGGAPAQPQALTLFGQRVVVGDRPGVRTEPNKEDMEEIAAAVRSASKLADYTIVTIHAHEGGQGGRLVPAEFLVTFARAMIDAGADVFVGPRPARAARDRNLQGQADPLQPRRLHLPERDAAAAAERELRVLRPRRRRPRLRFQRPAVQQRHARLSGRPADLGIGRRDAEVQRQVARRARAPSDLARIRQAAEPARTADAGGA